MPEALGVVGGPANLPQVARRVDRDVGRRQEFRRLTVVTNSLASAQALAENDGIETILIGGVVQPRRKATLGALAARFLDRVFDGAAGDLVQSLLRSEKLAPEELERMHALIAAARRNARNR